jgi:spore coat polysaccharide biosynthesis protein SpsF (cytidylyltransferase family)
MKQKKRVVAIIQARMGSTRLPGKVMKPLLNKPVLWHVINRVSRAKNIETVIVATTINEEDDVIYKFCVNNKISVFRGSDNDVLDRYYQCAKKYNITDIARITADCPLHDPNVIDKVIDVYLNGDYDYVTNTIEYTFPDGLDVEVFSFDALEDAWNNAKLPSEREHVTPYIRNNERFKKKNVISSKKYPPYRLSLDQIEDYQFMNEIYEGIGKELFYLDEIIDFIEKNPKLLKINQNVGMNEGYVKSLKADAEDTPIVGERIYLRRLSKHIGNMKLVPIDLKNRRVIEIVIGNNNYWDRSKCIEALRLLVDYAFKKLKLKETGSKTTLGNVTAMRCFRKVGFRLAKIEEGATKGRNKSGGNVTMKIENY